MTNYTVRHEEKKWQVQCLQEFFWQVQCKTALHVLSEFQIAHKTGKNYEARNDRHADVQHAEHGGEFFRIFHFLL